jgi:hypothetical protein
VAVDEEGQHRGHRSLAGVDASVPACEDEHAAPIDAGSRRRRGVPGHFIIIRTAMSDPRLRSVDALDQTVVHLEGVRPAGEAIPWVGRSRCLHAGPPVGLDELPGPMRGALLGALVFEGEAQSLDEAEALLASGAVEIEPCHDHRCVGAMAGNVSSRMPVVVVASGARRAFSPLNEGLGKALRFGSNDRGTLDRLEWLADVCAPALDRAIAATDAIDLTEMVAEGLRRGDECHNRNVASTASLMGRMAPAIAEAGPGAEAARVLAYGFGNRHFFLPFSIATGKLLADAAHGVERSPVVTAMCGNGRRLGIRVSGLGDEWFTATAPLGEARFFDGYGSCDATPTMGDSFISEVAGWGALALRAAPAIVSFIGGDVESTRRLTAEMRQVCVAESARMLIPGDGFRGTPLGIDAELVARQGIAPVVNNGIAHRDAGVGQVGAGITRLPLEPFERAAEALAAGAVGGGRA